MQFLSYLINGISLGSVYALIALGYTMVYGIVKLINFAHGDIMMVGAYAIYWMMSTTMMKSIAATHPIVAGVVSVLFAVVVCVVLGVLIDRIAYKPLRNAPRISALITAIGISLALEITAQLVFGSGQMNFPTIVPKITIFKVGRRSVNLLEVLTFAVSMLLMIGLTLFVQTTRTGKAMRAVSEDQGAAMLMGVNVDKTISITFGIGCALAAIGSVFYAQKLYYVTPLLGMLPGLKAFVAAVLGGIGSIPGAVLGGFIIGIAETFIKYYASEYVDAMVFGILILVLLFRPSGILGKKMKEKV